PELREGANYLAVKMVKNPEIKSETRRLRQNSKAWKGIKPENEPQPVNTYAIIEVPTHLFSRFVVLPKMDENRHYIMMLEDVIRYNLNEIFNIFDYDHIEAHSFKSSKDAEMDLDQDVQKSFMDRISRSVERR
ncbi:polyphosphate kinase 1, partial [Ornithobacterium rhinotracheale]